MSSFLPTNDAGLLAWSVNFSTLILATPAAYGLTVPQATDYDALHINYAAAYQMAVDPITRTKGKIAAKNTARAALKENARLLAKIVEGQANVTDEQKINLGLNVRKDPTPVPPPETSPDIDVVSVIGRTVTVRLHDASTLERRKPEGVIGASVFSYVGENAPAEPAAWTFQGNTTKQETQIVFPVTAPAAAKVWFTAFWFNRRAESGPGASPISTYLQYGGEMPQAA